VKLLARYGLALTRPRAALAVAGARDHAGRSGSDLLLAFVVLVLVTRARALASSVWVGMAIGWGFGLRGILATLTDALAIDLGFLVIGALVIYAAAGRRRDLGRASDLACVAVLPVVVVELLVAVILLAAQGEPSRAMLATGWLAGAAWTGILIALGTLEARRPSSPPDAAPALARRTGWGLAALVVAGVAVQGIWLSRYMDNMRPAAPGDPAPEFTLPRIAAKGARGEPFSLASTHGKLVVVDFWATWCNPCMKSLPHLAAFQTKHPDAVVIAINIDDDPAEARAVFDEAHYPMTLLAGDDATKTRYSVGAIPHTVLIDRAGLIRRIARGNRIDLEREISAF
jgi:thiol-disulfide isomerase/thioredoxin